VCPEVSPKWETLSEVLKEIHRESDGTSQTVLVLVESVSTCKQLKQVSCQLSPQHPKNMTRGLGYLFSYFFNFFITKILIVIF
jgi:hypothetical protein